MSNDRHVVRCGPFEERMADGVRVGGTMYLSAHMSVDNEGKALGAGDLAAQVRHTYVNVAETLAGFGASLIDVVEETWLVTDMAETMGRMEELCGIRAEAYGAAPNVAQTVVEVSALALPELAIAVKCIAHR